MLGEGTSLVIHLEFENLLTSGIQSFSLFCYKTCDRWHQCQFCQPTPPPPLTPQTPALPHMTTIPPPVLLLLQISITISASPIHSTL